MADQKKYTTKLVNSRILIIGGSSGLGYAVAEATLEHGAIVTISSSNPSRVHSAVESLKTSYPSASNRIFGLTADLSSPKTLETEVETLFQATVQNTDAHKLDHVVYTAGDALATMPLSSITLPQILKAGQLRFFAPLLIAKFLPAYLVPSHKSSYIITSGGISERPAPDWSVVGAYAGGHHSMVRNLAIDLKPIRVNGVSPGAVDTELWRMGEEERRGFLEACARRMATGVAPTAAEVAESYLAALRDWNMDGAMVRSDGGSTIM